MAFPSGGTPCVTKDTTTTSGTGTLTLDNTTGTGYRTPKEANTQGVLPTGSTVSYQIYDSTRAGSHPKLLEKGSGVWADSGGGGTLTRPPGNVRQPAGGIISLDGNQVDVLLVTDPLERDANGADVLDASAFLANVGGAELTAGNLFAGATQVMEINTAGTQQVLRTRNRSAGSSANRVAWSQVVLNGSGAQREGLFLKSGLTNLSAGSEEGIIELQTYVAGTLSTVLKLTGAGSEVDNLTDSSAVPYDKFPSGTELIFCTTPPAGWTRQNETLSRVLRMAKSGETIGAVGSGRDIFSGYVTQGHTLTVSEMPAHAHEAGTALGGTSGATAGVPATYVSSGVTTSQTGGGGSHSHDILSPHYVIACRASKD